MSKSAPLPYTSLDLFAGAGGLSRGLADAGFKPLYANELVPQHAATYLKNHPEVMVDPRDIRDVDASQIRKDLGLQKGELSLIAGGPPCQGFSINAPRRSTSDQRNHLFREYLRFVEEFEPSAVVIENVPGLVSFESGKTLEAILAALDELEYDAAVRILYAPFYGVPQTRFRTVIIGTRRELKLNVEFPKPSFNAPIRVNFTSKFQGNDLVILPESGVDLESFVTVSDALEDLPALSNGERGEEVKNYAKNPGNWYQDLLRSNSGSVENHEASALGRINLLRLAHIPQGGNWTDIPEDLLPAGMRRARRSDHTKRYGRVRKDGLASTVLTKCDPHWGAYFHYEQDRTFTVREAARIQSFPDDYVFTGSRAQQYEQVGNAVPPLLARAVGAAIRHALSQLRTDMKGVA